MTIKSRRGTSLLSLLLIVFTFLFASSTYSQTDSCVSASCHSTIGKNKFVHNPVKDGCTTCHQVVRESGNKKTKHPGNLTITLSEKEPALCLQCHPAVEQKLKAGKVTHPPVQQSCTPCHNPHGSDLKAMLNAPVPALCNLCHEPKNTKKVVHAPITGGDCLTCHHPHQSPNKGMLREPMPQICFQCHPDSMMKQKVMHPPAAAGDCSGCHDNHQSDFPNRLNAEGNKLCFTCHPDKEEELKTKKAVHPPVRQSCVQCHSPHGSANKVMMSAPVPALCSKCHPNETSLREKAVVKHGPMIDSKTCMNCHTPHASDQARLLPEPQMNLCLRCHSKPLDTERGKILDMKTWLSVNKSGHGPVQEKDCVSCHNPHGSDYWRILSRYYPADFYTAYSDGKYALCFSCHEKSAFQEPRTDKATNFRNGNKNLHFVHVNKVAKGRTCRACHEVHADNGSGHHIRQSVGFNGWAMPMNYSLTKTGGSCAPGCHEEKTYSR